MAASSPVSFGQAFGQSFGAMAPAAILGAVSLPFQLMEGAKNREFQKSAVEAQLGSADFMTRQEGANRLMGLFSQQGENMSARNASLGYGSDLDLGRQLFAKRTQLGEFSPKEMGLAYESAKRSQDLATSPGAKENLYQNLLNYKRQKGFELTAPMAQMFGPTAFSNRFQ